MRHAANQGRHETPTHGGTVEAAGSALNMRLHRLHPLSCLGRSPHAPHPALPAGPHAQRAAPAAHLHVLVRGGAHGAPDLHYVGDDVEGIARAEPRHADHAVPKGRRLTGHQGLWGGRGGAGQGRQGRARSAQGWARSVRPRERTRRLF